MKDHDSSVIFGLDLSNKIKTFPIVVSNKFIVYNDLGPK